MVYNPGNSEIYPCVCIQARTKALREQQRSRLDGRHKYIVSLVALHVDLTDAEVEDNLLDGNQVFMICGILGLLYTCSFFSQLNYFDDFFAAHGRRCILLYYQEAETPVAREFPCTVVAHAHTRQTNGPIGRANQIAALVGCAVMSIQPDVRGVWNAICKHYILGGRA